MRTVFTLRQPLFFIQKLPYSQALLIVDNRCIHKCHEGCAFDGIDVAEYQDNEVPLCAATSMYSRNSPMVPPYGEPACTDDMKRNEKCMSWRSNQGVNFS
jgi:hypothetical protein